MKYFENASERAASGSEDYREFQRPDCGDGFWLEDSIYISNQVFHDCGFYDLWGRCMQDDLVFDMDTINMKDLRCLLESAERIGGTVLQTVLELKSWAEPLLTTPRAYISVVTAYDRAYEAWHQQGGHMDWIHNFKIDLSGYSDEERNECDEPYTDEPDSGSM